jgi:hypothetical protein
LNINVFENLRSNDITNINSYNPMLDRTELNQDYSEWFFNIIIFTYDNQCGFIFYI